MTAPESVTVSALLPVRNGMPYLPAALRSLQLQTRRLDEIIIVDDGSDDETPAILRKQADEDPGIKIVSQRPAGLVSALNRGLETAKGTWVLRLDADDVARPQRLEAQLSFISNNPDLVFVGCAYGFIDKDGRRLGRNTHLVMREPGRFDPLHDPNVPHQGVIYHRETVLDVGGYRELVPAEDLDLWLRLAEDHELGYIDDVLVDVRIRRDGISTSRFMEQRLMWAYVRTCARARRLSEPEPDFDDWRSTYRVRPAKRLRWKAEHSLRLAATSWAEGQYVIAVGSAVRGLALHPPSVWKKARRLKRHK